MTTKKMQRSRQSRGAKPPTTGAINLLSKMINYGLDRIESHGTEGSTFRDPDEPFMSDLVKYDYAKDDYHVYDCFKEYPDFAKYYETTVTDCVRERFPAYDFQMKGHVVVGGFEHDFWYTRITFDSEMYEDEELEIEHWVHLKKISWKPPLSVRKDAYTNMTFYKFRGAYTTARGQGK
jgi:hypothetical protein